MKRSWQAKLPQPVHGASIPLLVKVFLDFFLSWWYKKQMGLSFFIRGESI